MLNKVLGRKRRNKYKVMNLYALCSGSRIASVEIQIAFKI